jgi:hypothetical protein
MAERPLLMSSPLVRAALADRKTQTRRLLPAVFNSPPSLIERWHPPGTWNHPTAPRVNAWGAGWRGTYPSIVRCPFGSVGDRLYARETWAPLGDIDAYALHNEPIPVAYRADPLPEGWESEEHYRQECIGRWRPSIHMPKWAARLWLEVTEVRVERLQEITPGDVCDEGFRPSTKANPIAGPLTWDSMYGRWHNDDYDAYCEHEESAAVRAFAALWDTLAPDGAKWTDNPWVWVVGFKRAAGGEK